MRQIAENQQDELLTIQDSQRIRIWAVTWNHGGALLHKRELSAFWSAVPTGSSHIIVIASQECGEISGSAINADKSEWEQYLQGQMSGQNYVLLAGRGLGATHCAVFVHKHLLPICGSVHTSAIACGIGNTLGNKGGVGIGLRVGHTSLLLVACHLASGQRKVAERNADVLAIDSRLQLVGPTQSSTSHASRATLRFDRVLWCGDMNYRVAGQRAQVERWLDANNHAACVAADQLTQQRATGKLLPGLSEGPLHFPPTYKLDLVERAADSDGNGTRPPTMQSGPFYDTGPKQRVPSWTDRVLFKPHDSRMALLHYDALMHVAESDHRPVVAQFSMKLKTHLKDVEAMPHPQEWLLPQHVDEHVAHVSARGAAAAASPVSPQFVPVGHTESQSCCLQ